MLFSVAAGGIESSDEAKLQRVVATDRMMMKLTFGGPLEGPRSPGPLDIVFQLTADSMNFFQF